MVWYPYGPSIPLYFHPRVAADVKQDKHAARETTTTKWPFLGLKLTEFTKGDLYGVHLSDSVPTIAEKLDLFESPSSTRKSCYAFSTVPSHEPPTVSRRLEYSHPATVTC